MNKQPPPRPHVRLTEPESYYVPVLYRLYPIPPKWKKKARREFCRRFFLDTDKLDGFSYYAAIEDDASPFPVWTEGDRRKTECPWSYDDRMGYWHAGCDGRAWEDDTGQQDLGGTFLYCPGCGKIPVPEKPEAL